MIFPSGSARVRLAGLRVGRALGIGGVLPDPDDQKGHRPRRGFGGGRPLSDDTYAERGRDVSERAVNGFTHWRGLRLDTTSMPSSPAAPSPWQAALIWLAAARRRTP